jgi:hypothetical protein
MTTPDYSQHRAARWRRDRLALIADLLPDAARKELDALIQAEGPPDALGNRGITVSSFVGAASPVDDAALRAMSLDTLLQFLHEWEPKPERQFDDPSPEGLARGIAKMVEDEPVRYAPWAAGFVGEQPTYVRAFIDGIAAAARAKKVFPWTEVLALAGWVVDQPYPESDIHERESLDIDFDLAPARRRLADLLGLALGRSPDEPGSVPFGESERLWKVIATLSEDPNPSPEYETRYGGTNMDPAALAINTTRPEAIDAAIRYAFWIAQNAASSKTPRGAVLKRTPKVANLLLRHLDSSVDPSLAVRAAIGQWLSTIARTDPEWVREHADLLLPPGAFELERRDALWSSFLRWGQPHPDALPFLDPYYRAASEHTGSDRGSSHSERPDDRLAEHLMTLYWWGAIPLDESDNLVGHFFAHADPERRSHAIQYVGFSLFHTEKPVATEAVDRLQRLWEWRVPTLMSTISKRDTDTNVDVRAAQSEFKEFGWWFASGAFEPEWALQRLAEVLKGAGTVDLSHAAAEKLAELAPGYPKLAVRCLAAIDYSGGHEPWSVRSWLEHLPTVIRAAYASGDLDVRREARDVVNLVVAAGYIEHRSLLLEADAKDV